MCVLCQQVVSGEVGRGLRLGRCAICCRSVIVRRACSVNKSSVGSTSQQDLSVNMSVRLDGGDVSDVAQFNVESKNQVDKKCNKCGMLKYVEDKQYEQLENQSEENHDNSDSNNISETLYCMCDYEEKQRNSEEFSRPVSLFPFVIILSFLFLLCIGYYAFDYFYLHKEKEFDINIKNQTQEEIDFDSELYGLEDIYKQQEEKVWYTFAAGIKSVISEIPHKPSVFLLLYDNNEAEKTIKCLTLDVTKAASKYLMKKEIKPLIYAGAELNQPLVLNDPGQLLVLHEKNVRRHGAMIVNNLQDVHPKVAASLHFFCDRYSPLVEKAIYMFTLKVKRIQSGPLQKMAEDELLNLWGKDLPENKLHPLITRMTGNVLKIINDYSNC